MKVSWVIPAAVCILLVIAWPFRWEKGPVQSTVESKIVHMRDRWTGQAWLVLYGNIDSQLLSGEMRPVPSQADIARRKERILSSPEQAQKKQELERQLAEYKRIMDTYDEGHRKYYWYVVQECKRRGDLCFLLWDWVRHEEYENAVPREIIEAQKAWVDAYRQVETHIPAKLYQLEREAETTAEAELEYLAWRNRNIATGLWGGLVAFSGLIAAILFIGDLRRRNSSKTSVLESPAYSKEGERGEKARPR